MHPHTLVSVWNLAVLLEAKGSFAEAGFGRLVSLFVAVLLGGDVNVGSLWKLTKWFKSDALLKGTDLIDLGKSVVKNLKDDVFLV